MIEIKILLKSYKEALKNRPCKFRCETQHGVKYFNDIFKACRYMLEIQNKMQHAKLWLFTSKHTQHLIDEV